MAWIVFIVKNGLEIKFIKYNIKKIVYNNNNNNNNNNNKNNELTTTVQVKDVH